MTEAGWTREKPTAAGWYWWRLDGVVAVVHITQPHWLSGTEPHKFIMYWYGQQYQLNQVGGEFKGPITPDSFQQGRVEGLREYREVVARELQLDHNNHPTRFKASIIEALDKADFEVAKIAQPAQDEKGAGG